jgi:PAS domain S-box-containing protein
VAAWALQRRQWLAHVDSHTAAARRPSPELEPTASTVATPMFVGGRFAGVLVFTGSPAHRIIPIGQIKALSVLASAGATALEVATLLTQVRAAELRYRRLAENAPDVIFRYDILPEPGFSYVNPSITAMTGYTPAEFYGDRGLAVALVHKDDRGVLEGVVTGRDADGRPTTLRWLRKDGGELWCELRAVAVRDGRGQVTAIEGIARDVTERRRMELELRRTNEDLKKFAWAASHDLQEPLRAIALHTQLLARATEGQLDERSKEFMTFAADGAKRILEMVRELRVYVEAGDVVPGAQSADSDAALEAAIGSLQTDLDAAGAQVTRGPLPRVRMSEAHLSLVFGRLLDNALKFRQRGVAPRIDVTATRTGGTCTFAVSDAGIGVDAAYHAQIFELFQRLNRREDYEGNGMGLPICRRVVEAYGGRLWVESEAGRGARFCFTVAADAGAVRA